MFNGDVENIGCVGGISPFNGTTGPLPTNTMLNMNEVLIISNIWNKVYLVVKKIVKLVCVKIFSGKGSLFVLDKL